MSIVASKTRAHGDLPEGFRKYYLTGPGAAEIRWGEGGDFYRAEAALRRHAVPHGLRPDEVPGLAANLHQLALGISTAEHTRLLSGGDTHGSTSAAAVKARGIAHLRE